MNTFVWRDILDNSISGDKIFGGTINWIDGLYVDALYVPHSGTSGVSTIDGSGVLIGYGEKIGSLNSELIIGDYFGLLGSVGYAASLRVQSSQYGVLGLKGASLDDIMLTAAPTLISYFVPKIMFGSKTEVSPVFMAEFNGYVWAEYLQAGTVSALNGLFTESLLFYDHDTTARQIVELTVSLQALAVNLLIGSQDYPAGPTLQLPFASVKDLLPYEIDQLGTIDSVGPITNGNWGFMAMLDQALTVAADVNFNSLTLVEALEIGTILTYNGSSEDIDKDQFEVLATLGAPNTVAAKITNTYYTSEETFDIEWEKHKSMIILQFPSVVFSHASNNNIQITPATVWPDEMLSSVEVRVPCLVVSNNNTMMGYLTIPDTNSENIIVQCPDSSGVMGTGNFNATNKGVREQSTFYSTIAIP